MFALLEFKASIIVYIGGKGSIQYSERRTIHLKKLRYDGIQ